MKAKGMPVDQIALAARVAGELTTYHQIAYAQLSPDLRVVQVSENFIRLFPNLTGDISNRPLQELLWEFVGAEDALAELLSGKASVYQLDRVNRQDQDGKIHYYNYRVVAAHG